MREIVRQQLIILNFYKYNLKNYHGLVRVKVTREVGSELGACQPRFLLQSTHLIQVLIHGTVAFDLGCLVLLQVVRAMRVDFDLSLPIFRLG